MRLVLVRHGESEGNAAGHLQGWKDYPLSERGREQAAAAARRLAREPVAAVYSSTLARATATAEIIAAPHGLEVTRVAGFREYGYGAAQGMTWAEVHERWPHDAEQWGVGHIPDEEGAEAFRRRVVAGFEALAERHGQELIVMVSHGGTIVQIVGHVLGIGSGDRARLWHANGALTTIDTGAARPVIVAMNDRCHLLMPGGAE